MSITLSSLGFSHLESQADQLMDRYSTESVEMNYPLLSTEGAVLDKRMADQLRDYHLVSEVLQSVMTRKGVSKQDILSLESLRPRFSDLDKLMSEHPLGMYTVESSAVLMNESMESMAGAALKAVTQWLNSVLKWLWESIQRGYERLTSIWVDNRKAEAKLDTLGTLRGYTTSVSRSLQTHPVAVAMLTRIRDERLQDFNKDLRENQIAYLKHAADYDTILSTLCYMLQHQLGALISDVNSMVREVSSISTADDVLNVVLKYTPVLANRRSTSVVFNTIGKLPPVKPLLTASQGFAPTVEGLIKLLSVLPISPVNNSKGQLHPVFFTTLMSSDVGIKPYDKSMTEFINKEIPVMVKKSRDVLSKPVVVTAANFSENDNVVKLVNAFRETLTGYSQLIDAVVSMVQVRATMIDKLASVTLAEVKQIDKWISTQQDLPIEVLGVRAHHQKQVMRAISGARL